MNDFGHRYRGFARGEGGQVSGRSNVMSPLNWFVGIAETALMSGLILGQETWVKIVCAALVVGVLVFYGYVYHFFMKTNPDRLQTEQFNLISQEMTLLSENSALPPTVTVLDTPGEVIEASVEPRDQR